MSYSQIWDRLTPKQKKLARVIKMKQMWDRLTPDQKELSLTIERKWLNVARCTDRIDRQQATDAINAVYLALGLGNVPKIIFADSPPAAIEMGEQRDKYTGQLSRDIYRFLWISFKARLIENLRGKYISFQPHIHTQKNLDGSYSSSLQILSAVSVQFWAYEAMLFDHACSVFGCCFSQGPLNVQQKWEAFQLLITHCGFISPFLDICFVSDRPTELIFKDDFILHAVDRPAVVFRDGYKIHVENGIYVSDSLDFLQE
jgi:hypothetical protein